MGCAGVLAGAGMLSLAGCSSLPLIKVEGNEGVLRIPENTFTEGKQALVRAASLPFDVLVTALPNGTYRSVYMRCSHRDQPLTATAAGLYCSSHGSRFGLDGTVEQGPATAPLRVFATAAHDGWIVVDLKN